MTFLDYFPSPTRILHEIQKELIEQTNKENSNIWREKHQILHTLDQQHHHPPQQQIDKPENSNRNSVESESYFESGEYEAPEFKPKLFHSLKL